MIPNLNGFFFTQWLETPETDNQADNFIHVQQQHFRNNSSRNSLLSVR